jgi:endogenous inhibitor of DNA gyrase (YacG/DUF329 family)
MNATEWKCPACAAPNTDDPTETAMPLCGGCGKDFLWEEVTE